MLTRRETLRLLAGTAMAAAMPGARSATAAPVPRRKDMIERAVPHGGEKLSVIGLGTWQAFDVGAGPKERDPQREVLRRFVEQGGRVVDSSPMYGRAEGVIGDLRREVAGAGGLFYATKVWTSGRDAGVRQMNRSFELLGAKRIDLMQVHNLVDWKTHLQTLRAWKAEGRVRHIGITHYLTSAFDTLASIIKTEGIDFVQLPYSVATREAERDLLAVAAGRGVAVLVNRPFEEGELFRRVRGKPLPEWAADIDCRSWGQLMLKYIVAHPAVTCVIPATSKPVHLDDNMQAGAGRLPDEALRRRIVAAVMGG